MDLALDLLSWTCLLAGGAFSVVGGIGLLRFPDLFTRMHAAGVTDTMGAGLILVGLMLQAGPGLVAIKLLLILWLLSIASPTSTHALAKSALASGIEPLLAEQERPPS